jgi:hypothetical protein
LRGDAEGQGEVSASGALDAILAVVEEMQKQNGSSMSSSASSPRKSGKNQGNTQGTKGTTASPFRQKKRNAEILSFKQEMLKSLKNVLDTIAPRTTLPYSQWIRCWREERAWKESIAGERSRLEERKRRFDEEIKRRETEISQMVEGKRKMERRIQAGGKDGTLKREVTEIIMNQNQIIIIIYE